MAGQPIRERSGRCSLLRRSLPHPLPWFPPCGRAGGQIGGRGDGLTTQTRQILAIARREASQSRQDAETEAQRRLAEADRQAQQAVSEAATQAERTLAQIHDQTQQAIAERETELARMTAEAEAQAKQVRSRARRDAQEIVSDAHGVAQEVLRDGSVISRNLRELSSSLRNNAERLLRDVKLTHGSMTARLDQVEVEERGQTHRGARARPPELVGERPQDASSQGGDPDLDVPEFMPRQ